MAARGLMHARCARSTVPRAWVAGNTTWRSCQVSAQSIPASRSNQFMQRATAQTAAAAGCTSGPGHTQSRSPARCAPGTLAHACDVRARVPLVLRRVRGLLATHSGCSSAGVNVGTAESPGRGTREQQPRSDTRAPRRRTTCTALQCSPVPACRWTPQQSAAGSSC